MGCKPKLRFPEFSGEWEFENVNNVFSHVRNGFVGTATPYYVEKGVPYLQSNNIRRNKIDKRKIVYINNEFHEKNKKSVLQKNDILMVQSGHAGECAVVPEEFDNANCHALIVMTPTKKINSHFCAYYMNSIVGKTRIHKLITGQTINHILASDLKKYQITLPTINEQDKIASFLSKVDSKIDKLEKKQELWETYKKGIMQQIFSQKLRFKDENGEEYPEWEEKKLGDICSIQMGQSPSSKYYTENPNDTILIQGNADLKDGKIVPRVYTTEITKKSDPDDIIMTVRAPVGDMALNQYSACIGRGVCAIKGEKFIYHLLNYIKMRNIWKKMSQGSTIDAVSSLDIKNLKILIPSLQEQAKITKFFSDINRKIDFLDKELKINREFKKGLLQLMFC